MGNFLFLISCEEMEIGISKARDATVVTSESVGKKQES